jgi:hypothetical protein
MAPSDIQHLAHQPGPGPDVLQAPSSRVKPHKGELMGWLSSNQNKSMLGQLLVKQKLITEEQLASAIELQRKTGQRLGDILPT